MQASDINEFIADKFWGHLWKKLNGIDLFRGDFVIQLDIEEYSLEVSGRCSINVVTDKGTYDLPEWNDVTKTVDLYKVTVFTDSDSFNFNTDLL